MIILPAHSSRGYSDASDGKSLRGVSIELFEGRNLSLVDRRVHPPQYIIHINIMYHHIDARAKINAQEANVPVILRKTKSRTTAK